MTGPDDRRATRQLALLPICLARTGTTDAAAMAHGIAALEAMLDAGSGIGAMVGNPALLHDGLRAAGRSLAPRHAHKLAALALRERQRSKLVAAEHALVAPLIAHHAPGAIPLRGWHIATQTYPDPLARHSHALRWWIGDAGELSAATAALAQAGYGSAGAPAVLTPHKFVFARNGGIAVELHDRPFAWPCADFAPDPAFTVAEIIGSALVEDGGQSLRWIIDIVQTLRREPVDPAAFAELVDLAGMAGLARDALALAADVLDRGETDTYARLALLRNALLQDRDGRQVRDIRRVLAIAQSGRARRLAALFPHPRLWHRARALRAERHATRIRAAALRRSLRPGSAKLP
jgi:hypothetical protein